MPLTREQARDEILALFKAAWDAQAVPPLVIYDNVKQPKPAGDPPPPYAEITLRHIPGGRHSINPAPRRRWERLGVLTVQVFTEYGKGMVDNDAKAVVAHNAFEGVATAGGVWFRRVNSREIGQSGPWFQTNVTAEFTYDEVR